MNKIEMLKHSIETCKQTEQRFNDFDADTSDNFLSRAANRNMLALLEIQLEILENGGFAEFPALYDLSGNLITDKIIDTRYGSCFIIETGPGPEFVNLGLTKRTLTKRGYELGTVTRPAWAIITGRGLSNSYVKVFQSNYNHADE